jgi:hypothetical protein
MTITLTPNTITLNSGQTLSTTFANREGINVIKSGNDAIVSGRVSFGGSNNSIDFVDYNEDTLAYNIPGTVRAKTYPVTRPSNIIGQINVDSATTIVNTRNWLFSNIGSPYGKETNSNISYTINTGLDLSATSITATMNMSVLPSEVSVPNIGIWAESKSFTVVGINVGQSAGLGSYTVNGGSITPTTIDNSFMGGSLTYAANYAQVNTNLTSVTSLGYTFTKANAFMFSAQMVHVLPGKWNLQNYYVQVGTTAQSPIGATVYSTTVKKWDIIFAVQTTPRDAAVEFNGFTSGPLKLISNRGGWWVNGENCAVYLATEDGIISYVGDATATDSDTYITDPFRILVFRSTFEL